MKKNILIKTITTALVDTTVQWEGDLKYGYYSHFKSLNRKEPVKMAEQRYDYQLSIKTTYKNLSGKTITETFGIGRSGLENNIARLSTHLLPKEYEFTDNILLDHSEKEISLRNFEISKSEKNRYEIICTEDVIVKLIQSRLHVYSKFGGTAIYCPSCKTITTCESLDYENFSKKSVRRFYSSEVNNVNWYARARKCRSCFFTFETVEIPKEILSEFLSLKRKTIENQTATEELAKTGKLISLTKFKREKTKATTVRTIQRRV